MTLNDKIIERFNEDFYYDPDSGYWFSTAGYSGDMEEMMVPFIEKLLAEQKQAMLDEIEKLRNVADIDYDDSHYGVRDALDDVKKAIEEEI